jgi:hypothetical protein
MSEATEEQIPALLRVLVPAPEEWVAAACEIPRRECGRVGSGVAESSPVCEVERDG